MAGNNSLELDIHKLFEDGNDLETICYEVIAKYEKSDVISPSEIESVSHFLMTAGRIDLLFKFYLKSLRKNSLALFPWGYFTEAVLQLANAAQSKSTFLGGEDTNASASENNLMNQTLLDLIEMGALEQNQEQSCIRSPLLVHSIPDIALRLERTNNSYALEKLRLKAKLMSELNQQRLYQTADQEEKTLQQLIKIFPDDAEIKLLHQAHLEKKADEILIRIRSMPVPSSSGRHPSSYRATWSSEESLEQIAQMSTQLRALAEKLVNTGPEQIQHLAMMAFQTELYELSLELLQMCPTSFSTDWLKAEVLFESGRFLDLLKHIEYLETQPSETVEATYGAVYMKAQAYYGLGQKDLAIRLLEALSQKAPEYRSTHALLHEWKTL